MNRNWCDTYEQVAALDSQSREVVTGEPHDYRGYRAGQRFLFLNVLEELDFRLREGSPALKSGFQPIPFDKIGLYRDEYR